MSNPASNALPERAVYKPPPDVFSWPQNAERGDDMVSDARARANASGAPGGAPSASASSAAPGASASAASSASGPSGGDHDDRPPSVITLGIADADAHRGLPVRLRGDVRADGEPCAHVVVEVWLRDPGTKPPRILLLGTLATGDDGGFSGGIVVPGSTPLGDYEVIAKTPGESRCGGGASN
jgi:hypothetical protein